MKKLLIGLSFLFFLGTAVADSDPGADVQTRFDQIKQAMEGDREAIDALAADSEDYPSLQFIVGTALARLGELDQASVALQHSIRQGDDMASLVLAELMFEAGFYLDAFAWAQVWVQSNFTLEEIRRGAANSDLGVELLRELLDILDDEEIRLAERHAGIVLSEWMDGVETTPGRCFFPRDTCAEWTATRRPAPRYPMQMGNRRQTGFTRHVYLVNEEGRVADQLVLHSSHPQFARSAERSLRRWRFESSSERPSPALLQTSVTFVIE
ncbi:MAG: energy transducer TonB [Wenzhouxiangella sp.]